MNFPTPAPFTTHHHSLPTGDLQVHVNQQGWDFEKCMDIGARINPKRGFLFVSKLLGKHIPTPTALICEAHEALLDQLAPRLKPGKPMTFIAMAETATGLGHGLYEAALRRFGADQPWIFLTSTRYDMGNHPKIDFLEEHSHAASQFMYAPQGEHLSIFLESRDVVLIDDEVSTGKTFLNLERSLKPHMPSLESVSWVTLTSLASETARPSVHLLNGSFSFESRPLDVKPPRSVGTPMSAVGVLSPAWGRMGVRGLMKAPDSFAPALTAIVAGVPNDKPILVLGQGEFMHAAVVVANELESIGVSCAVQSTTRSPVMVWGAIGCAMNAPDPLGDGVDHFVYNLDPNAYAKVIVLCERQVSEQTHQFCEMLGNASPLVMDGWSSRY